MLFVERLAAIVLRDAADPWKDVRRAGGNFYDPGALPLATFAMQVSMIRV